MIPGPRPPRVLVVEDQERVAKALAVLLELAGIASVVARSPAAALSCLSAGGFDLVLQDMNFTAGATSGAEGRQLFDRIREAHPAVPLILLTAWAQLETAVELMRDGAADYIEKPWDDAKLIAAIRARLSSAARSAAALETVPEAGSRAALAGRYDLCGLIYESAAMHSIATLAARVASSEVAVLITGESGTGKEKLAEILHANSTRRDRPFVRVDAGALPESLLEAELFGAEAGAFTGITRRRIGRFESADGGTLLLDEIGNLTLPGQAKLLRVLQSGQIERLGSSQTIAVDVRVVAATNLDMHRAIAAGTFREDLYYRMAVIEIAVPPLSRRREDILPLAEHFLAETRTPDGRHRVLAPASRQALLTAPWPGNVRELRNRIQRAALLAQEESITPADLGLEEPDPIPSGGAPADSGIALSESRPMEAAAERRMVEGILVECGGVVSRAADQLGLSRQALYRRMERLGIVLERRPRS
ncbi:MAG: sigma-54 dependent transcriptional regulator [Thermoanaerobaculia bacterium]